MAHLGGRYEASDLRNHIEKVEIAHAGVGAMLRMAHYALGRVNDVSAMTVAGATSTNILFSLRILREP
jgi:hypothetical protein